MKKQEKIEKIYEVIAYKKGYNYLGEDEVVLYGQRNFPVMIGDVLDWIEKNNMFFTYKLGKFTIHGNLGYIGEFQRKHLRKPIEDQSDGCVDFIYNLLPQ